MKQKLVSIIFFFNYPLNNFRDSHHDSKESFLSFSAKKRFQERFDFLLIKLQNILQKYHI